MDWDVGVLHLDADETKNRLRRYIAVPRRLREMLREMWEGAGRPAPSALIFPTERGTPYVNNLRRALRKSLRRAGLTESQLKGMSPRALRRTTRMLINQECRVDGVMPNDSVLDTIMGHGRSNRNVGDKHYNPTRAGDYLRPWMQALEDIILGAE
jgi:integrase